MPNGVVHTRRAKCCPQPSPLMAGSGPRAWQELQDRPARRNAAGGGTSRAACPSRTPRGGGALAPTGSAAGRAVGLSRLASWPFRWPATRPPTKSRRRQCGSDGKGPGAKKPPPPGLPSCGADASPRRPGGRAAPQAPPGRRRQSGRSDRGPQEPLRPPGQAAACRYGRPGRAAPRPAGGAGLDTTQENDLPWEEKSSERTTVTELPQGLKAFLGDKSSIFLSRHRKIRYSV
ncbi:cuticle collagen 2-like [Sciurus carolinensis]|uniref:cuticle collagen 2-like n=1 Tax=Sciurus carolinensis TaxID=30640 RepID=UPI001FB32B25|nr:cuticle collagen 2-like [Sciurus carolinensis]XP_047376908.1 cuticle collagen 2-like [Sciurus carolinensis]XP_047376909.1 cuticle collagen 2-like [Sciurus carolinensis]XP_047376910.1 cuticle collagen 2-like [Sciurus carolinensis]XP_047376911.1 cuticle collagen 2-like [Sciurus carolinensis]XP_047376912.1 cuticle collagen 2-like [Sciurus carolinensis]